MKLVYWPDYILRQASNPVKLEDISLFRTFVDDLVKTMYEKDGVGLSAIQVGNNVRLFVLDIGFGSEVYFNPVITEHHGDIYAVEEGCLSVPGVFENVQRYRYVKGTAYDKAGKQFKFEELPGTDVEKSYRAHVIQHESEHLDGKIFLDHLSQGKRDAARRHMKKMEK